MKGEKVEKNIFKISFPRSLSDQELDELKRNIKSWQLEGGKLYLFDFAETLQISRHCRSELLRFIKTLRDNSFHVASLNVCKSVAEEFLANGILNSFNPVDSLDKAKSQAGLVKARVIPKVDAKFLGIFVEQTQKTLEIQANTKVISHKKPLLRTDENTPQDIAIAGVIGLSSDKFKGSISLCFPKKTFLKIYKNMVDEDCTEIDNEIQDAAGELLNIIYGQAKAILVNENNYDLKPAIPSILAGEKLKIRHQTTSPVIILSFKTEVGDFHIEITITDTNENLSSAA